ncbi:MAG TPA: amino acid racemase [Gemmatimonadaceae bacterium]|nr:amino acid racemase [Gemmatimonadaceae bacterium]
MINRCGLVGGMGPESTVDYYKLIVEHFRGGRDGAYPELTVDIVDLKPIIRFLEAGDRGALTDFVLGSVERLARGGCTFAALTSNTSHTVFTDVAARSPIPLVSIVEAAAEYASELRLARPALLATTFTVKAGFYQQVFTRYGMTIVTPSDDEQAYLHQKYMDELVHGIVRDDTRAAFVRMANRLAAEERADGLILGGTEIPLLLRDARGIDLPVIDTAIVHVKKLVQMMRSA